MRFLILSFLLLFNLNYDTVHDSVKATFNLIKKGHVIMLEIDFSTENFLKVNHSEGHAISKDVFADYLNNTTSWEIDGVKITPRVLSIKSNGHHTKIVCFLSKASKSDIQSINITNQFLMDVESHINVIKVDVNKTFRDFKMDKNRQELSITFSNKNP